VKVVETDWANPLLHHRSGDGDIEAGGPQAVPQSASLQAKRLEEQPKDATHWSTRSMAAATGMSQTGEVQFAT
jgi:hypothetical protein